MATTYALISSNTLGSSAASVSFSAIPSTYTDLCIKISVRNDTGGVDVRRFNLTFNGTGSGYSQTYLQGTGSVASTAALTGVTYIYGYAGLNGNTTTANTFSSSEIYIPNYAGSASKPMSLFNVTETNATAINMTAIAGLSNITSAITSITIAEQSANNFVTGSSFYLYGISKS
jgi:hypothetical protein